MAYPTDLDTLSSSRGTASDTLSAVPHVTHHTNEDNAIEALEAKVGVDGSAVTTSHDYKLGEVTSTDKAVGKTATQTLTNKTLTAPKIALGSDAKGDILQLSDTAGTLTSVRATTDGDIISWDSATSQWETIPNPAATNASTTVKGVAELATLAETLARTTVGDTGANLVVTPDNLTTVLTYDYAVDSVGTDSYAITVAPAPTAYVAGQVFTFKAGTANTTGCTLNVNSLGAKSIVKNGSSALETGDILSGQVVRVVYDGTNMQVVSKLSLGVTYKNGTTTYNIATASGTQTIAHGLGVVPKRIRISFNRSGTTTFGVATYNGSNVSTINNDNSNGTYQGVGSTIVAYGGINQTEYTTGTITTDATNISIAWVKTNSPSGTLNMMWEAEY